MSAEVDIRVEARDLRLRLSLEDKESLAIVGPNGSGKSTALAALAGLLHPDGGRVTLAGKTVFDAERARQATPAHRREVAMLSQDALLFPHMSVLHNVAFGPRSLGRSRRDSLRTAKRWLEVVDAGHLADRRPRQLSGGQAQRVALARALAPEPRLLLLDEPMAALDAEAVPAMRRVLSRVIEERSVIMVTHDVLDAIVLTKRTIVIEKGRIVDDGPTERVLMQPRADFAASLAGVNLLRGIATGPDRIKLESGEEIHGTASHPLTPGSAAVAVFSPAAAVLALEPQQVSARNALVATIVSLENQHGRVRVDLGQFHVDVTPAAVAELQLQVGSHVHVLIKALEVTLDES